MKITLFTILLSVYLATTFGKKTPDKIILLTDYYTNFIKKVEADNKQLDSIYKEDIQNGIHNKYFIKSEYAFIVNDFFAASIKNTSELKNSIDRITLTVKQ